MDPKIIELKEFFYIRGHSQTTWTERHTYMVREMSTNVHVRYIHGQPFVHVGMNFSIIVFKDRKIVKSAKVF